MDFAHVYARGSHPQSVGGQSEVAVCDGRVNRSSQVVKSVDGLACSCRGIEWCDCGSSCAQKRRIEVEDKNFMK